MLASVESDDRQAVDVAVGVLIREDGAFLLCSRPAGKVYEGHWEFPGGKLEPGETVEEALGRELHEELGIRVTRSERWRVEMMSYPHAKVRLHFCKVQAWHGEPLPREHQHLAWQQLPVAVKPLLRGTLPVLDWLACERAAVTQGHEATLTLASEPTRTTMSWIDAVRFDDKGLVPAIAQEAVSRDVLMVAWMDREALQRTVATGEAHYFSRSRQRIWHKGEASGHVQRVHEVRLDCDADVILLTVTQLGHDPSIACHTGRHACFFQKLEGGEWKTVAPVLKDPSTIYTSGS